MQTSCSWLHAAKHSAWMLTREGGRFYLVWLVAGHSAFVVLLVLGPP